jgi:hypothetical protein
LPTRFNKERERGEIKKERKKKTSEIYQNSNNDNTCIGGKISTR